MTLFLLALALSMDAFAVAVGQGAAARHPTVREAIRVGLAFGSAQALMPLIGWALGLALASVIREIDHWIAFVLLTLIGCRMIYGALNAPRGDPVTPASTATGWALISAAIATSVDAAAAGVTLPLLDQPVLIACAMIGMVTLVLSTAGVYIGAAVGAMVGRRAELLGGLALIGIGTKILIEHLYFGG